MTLFQIPNKSALTSIMGFIIGFTTNGVLEHIALIIGTLSGVIWSYQEITSGINIFRKSLGIIGIIGISLFLFLKFQ